MIFNSMERRNCFILFLMDDGYGITSTYVAISCLLLYQVFHLYPDTYCQVYIR